MGGLWAIICQRVLVHISKQILESDVEIIIQCVCVGLVAQLCPLFVVPWTVVNQNLLSMEFFKQEYRNGLLFCTPGDLPYPGVEPESFALAGGFFTTEPPEKPKKTDIAT